MKNAAIRKPIPPNVATDGANSKALRNPVHLTAGSSDFFRKKSLTTPIIYGLDASPCYIKIK